MNKSSTDANILYSQLWPITLKTDSLRPSVKFYRLLKSKN